MKNLKFLFLFVLAGLIVLGSCEKNDRDNIMQYFISYAQSSRITIQGAIKSAIILNSGIVAELRLVNETEFPFLLLHTTGSKNHNTHLP